jgi:superfamily II DNA or RNA helicase
MMLVKLPAVMSVKEKTRFSLVRQLLKAESTIRCDAVRYTVDKSSGFVLTGSGGEHLAYIFPTKPKSTLFPSDAPIVVASFESFDVEELNLSHGLWWQHPDLVSLPNSVEQIAISTRTSWRGAFNFALEDSSKGIVGLRKPQLGALHAIHAHWSTSSETATIVMPTGTGKTETMLSTLISAGCERVLVVVPTEALRTQIAEKFETLGILKIPKNAVLAESAQHPVVGTLISRPKLVSEVESLFQKCNVVITTNQLVGQCNAEVQARIAQSCTHLFIDEAHHAEALTWRSFRELFHGKYVLQFTATPFREDGQKIDGRLIYVYPLKKAQEEGYFRPIRFHPVSEFNAERGDREIALAALKELDSDISKKHIVMARVGNKKRAAAILELYKSLGRYEAVAIHSGMKPQELAEGKRKLFDGTARVVICVDMLGEGFDLPELKIAAFHDIRKSLSVTLQLAGRFTRAREDLGDPVFITNIALIDVRDELRKLYAQEPDWNSLLPELIKVAIDEEISSQEFFKGFETFLSEIPLKDLRPAASMVVYKTNCSSWTPKMYPQGFKGLSSRDKLFHSLNREENTLVILAATESGVRWSDVESIRESHWELFIAVWDMTEELLYLHGSGISGEYKELAKALCGSDVQLVVAPNVFRCFHSVNRLVLNNVGLEEHLGRQVRYTARMGSDVEARVGQAVRRTAKRSVLAGKGYERGEKVSVGAAKRGRVWSSLRLRIDTFGAWARAIGKKIGDDEIDPNLVLEGTLKPVGIGTIPQQTVIAVDWPKEILERPEYITSFSEPSGSETTSTHVDIEIEPRDETAPILVRVFSATWESILQLELMGSDEDFDFRFIHKKGVALRVKVGGREESSLENFFTECPPIFWFADGSSLEGCEFTKLPSSCLLPYHPDRLEIVDWSGVDIRSESQGENKRPGTIQYKIIEMLQKKPAYSIIFDDDGAGEAADVVAITVIEDEIRSYIEVELYHLKYSSDKPGGRVDDLYVVCGQAQRSTCWLVSHDRRTDLFNHLLKRNDLRVKNDRATRFERGTAELLIGIRELSRRANVRLKVFVVQPGLSKQAATANQMALLAVTERYLSDTYELPFFVMCSA